MSDFIEDKAVGEEEERNNDEFEGLPEDEPEASDSGGSDGSDSDESVSDDFWS